MVVLFVKIGILNSGNQHPTWRNVMKVLINTDFKAMRQGSFVAASEECGEFVFDSDNCDFTCATLSEIAIANKIKIKKEKRDLMILSLTDGLTNLKLPEQNQMSNSEKVKQIILEGFEKEKDDDQILVEMVQAGISFRNAGKMFRQCVEENGLRISSKKRQESILEILERNEFVAESYDAVQDMADRIAVGDKQKELEPVADTSRNQALKVIRKYCKDLEIEFPKADRIPKGGLRARFLSFAASNPLITDAELEDWYVSSTKQKSDDQATKWMNRYSATINHGRAVAAKALEIGDVAETTSVQE